MDALIKAISIVLPVLIVLLLGHLFARYRNFEEAARGISGLVYWICLPVLIFRDVARADPLSVFEPRLCLGVGAVLLFTGVCGYRYARWRNAPVAQVGVIAQAAFRSNMLYVGLPILLYYVGSLNAGDESASQAARERAAVIAAMTFSIAIPILNASSILYFILPRRHEQRAQSPTRRVLQTILFNPMIIAVILGLLTALTPALKALAAKSTVLGQSLDLIGPAALPLALFAVGAMLDLRRACSGLRQEAVVVVVVLKLLIMPLLGLAILWYLGLRQIPLAVGLILLACPTAAASHAVAVELQGDETLAGDLVAVTTLLCPFTLVVWLAILQAL